MTSGENENKGKTLGYVGTKRKGNTTKITIQLEEINQQVLSKEGRLKRHQQKVKQYRLNRTFQKS